MTNIFHKIKQWLIKSEQKTDDNQLTAIHLILDKDNEPYIKITVVDTSDDAADVFALMLTGIHHGKYLDAVLKVLVEIGSQDKQINNFVKRVFNQWSSLENKHEQDLLSPQVKPTEFFKGSKYGT